MGGGRWVLISGEWWVVGVGAICGVTEWVWWERAGEAEVKVEVKVRYCGERGMKEAERPSRGGVTSMTASYPKGPRHNGWL